MNSFSVSDKNEIGTFKQNKTTSKPYAVTYESARMVNQYPFLSYLQEMDWVEYPLGCFHLCRLSSVSTTL
jgi:hypothetical protein